MKSKIEKLEKLIEEKDEELKLRNKKIIEANEKFEELKKSFKEKQNLLQIESEKEQKKLKEKITSLSDDNEIKKDKLDNYEQKHHNLQIKYLKLLAVKRTIEQENVYFTKKNLKKDRIVFNSMNSISTKELLDTFKNMNKNKSISQTKIAKKINLNRLSNDNNSNQDESDTGRILPAIKTLTKNCFSEDFSEKKLKSERKPSTLRKIINTDTIEL